MKNPQDDSSRQDSTQGGSNKQFTDQIFVDKAPRFLEALKDQGVLQELVNRAGLTTDQVRGYESWFRNKIGMPRTAEVVAHRIDDTQAAAIGPNFWNAVLNSPQVARQSGLTPEKLADFVTYVTTQLGVDIKTKAAGQTGQGIT